MIQSIFKQIEAKKPELLNLLKDIVAINSYTPDKADVDAVGAYIKTYAEKSGFHVKVVPFERAGNGMVISWNEDAELPAVAMTGHMDTVFPKGTFSEPLFREENGKFYGPGVVDMKGGIAVGLLVMRALDEAGYRDRPIKFILIGDEERSEELSGEAGKEFIRSEAKGCAAAITVEGGVRGKVTVGRKGSISYHVRVKGKAAHAGAHYADGISAVKEAAQKVLAIEAASDPEQITYNCGVFSGGTAPNTVPENCEFTLNNRYWKVSQRDEIRSHVESIVAKSFIQGTSATFEIIGERPPMEATPGNYALAAHVNEISEKYGFGTREPYLKPAGSDASYTTLAGTPSVCSMGPMGGGAHTTEEYADAASFETQAKLIAAVIAELPKDFGNSL